MTAPTTAPLAALLASHPEECAAVVALLASEGRDGASLVEMADEPECKAFGFDRVREIVRSAEQDGFLTINRNGQVVIVAADRYAIARVGAAAWLRARVGAPVTEVQRQRAALARLHEIAAEEARAGRLFSWSGPVVGPAGYRAALSAVRGVDVEAEVAAVWGPAPDPKETAK